MPFIGFTCDVDHDPRTVQECADCAAGGALGSCPMTAPVVQAIAGGLREDNGALSVTSLIACPRKFVLKQRVSYRLSPAQSWWALRGTLFHSILSAYAGMDFSVTTEHRYSMVSQDGVTLTGQPDLIDHARGHLIDFKSTTRLPAPQRVYYCPSTSVLIRTGYCRTKYVECNACLDGRHIAKDVEGLIDPSPKSQHVRQLNLYRLLLAENGIDLQTGEIIYFDMTGLMRMPVELDPVEQTRAWVEQRLAWFDQIEDELPDILTAPGDLWECDYCPVRAKCEEYIGHPVGHPRADGD